MKEIDEGAKRAPYTGRPVIQRLNRIEYTNAVRDLLAFDVDIRSVLPSIQVPCLVLVDVDGTRFQDPRNGRYIADHIPAATVVEYQCIGRWDRPAAQVGDAPDVVAADFARPETGRYEDVVGAVRSRSSDKLKES